MADITNADNLPHPDTYHGYGNGCAHCDGLGKPVRDGDFIDDGNFHFVAVPYATTAYVDANGNIHFVRDAKPDKDADSN